MNSQGRTFDADLASSGGFYYLDIWLANSMAGSGGYVIIIGVVRGC